MLRLISNYLQDKEVILFAITNACNCKCKMCSIWKQKEKKIVRFKEAKKALKILHENNFGFLQITGGEPLMNPDALRIIKYAKKLGFVVFLVTNGTLIDKKVAHELARTKVDNIGISFHHYNEKVFEKISGHKNILHKVINAIENLKEKKISLEALFTLTKYNKDDIEETVKFINRLGISVNFSMPMIVRNTSYTLGGSAVKFSREELKNILLKIIHLKEMGYHIVNNKIFLEETVNFLEKRNKFYCVGGYKIFYLDWNLNFYPCMFKGKPIQIDKVNFNFKKEVCNECLFQCFREPSLFLISKLLTLKLILSEAFDYSKLIKL